MPVSVLRSLQIAMFALGGCACGGGVLAASPWDQNPPAPNVIEDVLRVEINLLNASFATTARVDADVDEPGTVFSAEDDLGIDDAQLLLEGEITLLPGERHLLRLSGMNTRRTGRVVLQRDIDYDDDTYEANEIVDSNLNLRLFGLTYGYRLFLTQRLEITPTLAIQIGEFDTNAVVRSRLTRNPTGDVSPVPLIGLEGRFDFTPRWSLEGRVQYMDLEIDTIEASVLDWRAGVTWRWTPHLLIGLGYRSFHIDALSFDPDSSGFVDLSITGAQLFFRASL